jgi:long-chain acyl-CoA synthetase
VSDVVVIGVQHSGYGEKVKAVVVERAKGSSSEAELIEFASARLAEYKVPKQVEFRDEVPRSPLGKVLRKYL